MSEKIIDLLLNSKLDATGLCIDTEDIGKIVGALDEGMGTKLKDFQIEETIDKKNPVVARHYDKERKIVFYINKYRNDIYRLLNLKRTQKYLVGLSKYEYEMFIKALNMMVLIHEFDHEVQNKIIKSKNINNPDYLLLALSHKEFRTPEVDSVFGESIGFGDMPLEERFHAAALQSVHDLIPYERMAHFHAYDQLINALSLSEDEKSRLISAIKILYLRPLLSSYTSDDFLRFTGNYDETHSPSTYYISHIGGIHYYGEEFQDKLLRLYRDYPLAYRFYAGIRIEREESRLYKEEIREASANLKR